MEKAIFGAGCFWGVELMFSQTPGVTSTAVGYMGGDDSKTTYEEVCSDSTGHAEVVHLTYDPKKVSYEKLLELFWENHNPTTPNRQGPDFGSQYRSVVFYHTQEQKKIAEAVMEKVQEKLKPKVVTQIVPAKIFHRAEEYHQQYLKKKGLRSCHI
jgi:peptide-methionine (S)-S-oxide reductase